MRNRKNGSTVEDVFIVCGSAVVTCYFYGYLNGRLFYAQNKFLRFTYARKLNYFDRNISNTQILLLTNKTEFSVEIIQFLRFFRSILRLLQSLFTQFYPRKWERQETFRDILRQINKLIKVRYAYKSSRVFFILFRLKMRTDDSTFYKSQGRNG